MKTEQYYALCVEDEIAVLDMGKNEYGTVLALAVYTSPDGAAQQEDLKRYESVVISPVSPQELLNAMHQNIPNTVFVDGRKLAGSVFTGILKDELSLPIKYPRVVYPRNLRPE